MILSAAHHLTQKCKAFCFTSHQDWIFCYFKYQKLILSVVQHNVQYQPEICARSFYGTNQEFAAESWEMEGRTLDDGTLHPIILISSYFFFSWLSIDQNWPSMLFRLSLNEHFFEKISQFFKESTDLVGQSATGLFLKIERPYRPVLTNSKRP